MIQAKYLSYGTLKPLVLAARRSGKQSYLNYFQFAKFRVYCPVIMMINGLRHLAFVRNETDT
jgi:hypothetical protein